MTHATPLARCSGFGAHMDGSRAVTGHALSSYSMARADLAISRSANFWILPVDVFGSSWNT